MSLSKPKLNAAFAALPEPKRWRVYRIAQQNKGSSLRLEWRLRRLANIQFRLEDSWFMRDLAAMRGRQRSLRKHGVSTDSTRGFNWRHCPSSIRGAPYHRVKSMDELRGILFQRRMKPHAESIGSCYPAAIGEARRLTGYTPGPYVSKTRHAVKRGARDAFQVGLIVGTTDQAAKRVASSGIPVIVGYCPLDAGDVEIIIHRRMEVAVVPAVWARRFRSSAKVEHGFVARAGGCTTYLAGPNKLKAVRSAVSKAELRIADETRRATELFLHHA